MDKYRDFFYKTPRLEKVNLLEASDNIPFPLFLIHLYYN